MTAYLMIVEKMRKKAALEVRLRGWMLRLGRQLGAYACAM